MSHCKKIGKDQVIFVTKEDHETPSSVTLPEDDDEPKGLILSNGEINWNCPCLGGMATGPCGVQFRDAFSCFHYSTTEPKGSDCLEQFREMQVCMSQYPSLYPIDDYIKEDDATEHLELENTSSGQTSGSTDVSSSSQTTATESEHLKQN